ncbi:alpha-L-rhamnosidase-related protein [Parapedobacter koreensis]|uniref:Alpha-L-rhamnosidase n=1 Tax=Parapedobacter koreensis TaxID=332977 RepID=A0A1H7RV88_9SPHI|nr:alpha-L-rhamnosidase C-terminal domain-containing protein [Parapedobacter koreensis]SEL63347.1 alpha-L-rhamnosidase [Parapedobacter koreensis]
MRCFSKSFRCMAALLISLSAVGQTTDWQAEWIGLPHAARDTSIWTAFYKTYSIENVPKTAYAKIATDSKYWLWINGKLVVFEGQLKRGPNPRDTYYDEVNLAPYLAKGKNTIAVLTWYWGRDGFNHKNSGQSALLFEATLGSELLKSDTTWKAVEHPAFGHTGPPRPNYRLPEFNIHFDARHDLPHWLLGDVGGRAWQSVVSYGVPPVAPWNKLEKRPIPMWYDSGLVAYENDAELYRTSSGDTVVAKLPKNISITPYLKIDAPSGLKIDIRTDNYKGGSEYNVRTEYVTREGVQEFETFGYMNGHEVRYAIPQGVKILELKYRETRYDTERVGVFVVDDPFYHVLWEKSYNTLNINLRDAIQDPDRERAQWWGDAVILLGEILYACDGNGQLAIQKAIRNLVDWQKPDGALYSPVPAGNWDRELPAQMLASIGKYGFWNYFRYTADTAMMHHVYPAVKRYLQLWEFGEDGLLIHRPGDWDWLDWGDDIDTPLIENAWYYMALEAAIQLADLTDNQVDIADYQTASASIKSNFNRLFWNGTAYKSPSNHGTIDDRGNGLAVVAGLADSSKYEAIKQVLKSEFHASPYMEKYILESFFIMGDAEGGLARMKKRYANMVESPLTTLWEGWGIGSAGYGGGSYNHGWSGGPLTLMHQYVAGIAPDRPGFETFSIRPQLGMLNEIHCITPTVKGNITVDVKRAEDRLSMVADIPPGTTARVGIPKLKAGVSKITVNDEEVRISHLQEDDAYYYFEVKAGKWVFITSK